MAVGCREAWQQGLLAAAISVCFIDERRRGPLFVLTVFHYKINWLSYIEDEQLFVPRAIAIAPGKNLNAF